MFPTLQHPSRYVWDFWYYFNPTDRLFHIFYLNADPALVSLGHHPYSACIGHATTSDFTQMTWGLPRVLAAAAEHWANTSLWTGDIVKIHHGFLLFFTSRNRHQDDGMTQHIGAAYAPSLQGPWQLTPLCIQPGHCYQRQSIPGDLTIHAWRDPFLFRDQGQTYMLVSAKVTADALGRNGAIALLRLQGNDPLNDPWEYLEPLARPGCYAEMEVPQIYRNSQGHYELVFSTWAKYDFATSTQAVGGLQGFTQAQLSAGDGHPQVLLPETAGLYACRIIPELGGEIVGFDSVTGGLRRSGVKTGFQHCDRDFSSLVMNCDGY